MGQWTSRETIKVYAKEGDTTSIKYLLSENDTLTAFMVMFTMKDLEKFWLPGHLEIIMPMIQ